MTSARRVLLVFWLLLAAYILVLVAQSDRPPPRDPSYDPSNAVPYEETP